MSPCKLSEHNFENITISGRFPKKTQKLLTEFPVLATSGRHNYTMITDRRKFTTKWSPYAMSSFTFTVKIDPKFFPWVIRFVQEAHPQFIFAMSVTTYDYRIVWTMDNAYISQLHAANHHRLLSHVTWHYFAALILLSLRSAYDVG